MNPNVQWMNERVYATILNSESKYFADTSESLESMKDPVKLQRGIDAFDNLTSLMSGAHIFHVQPEMTDLVMGAATGLDDLTTWHTEFLPTQVGFAYFDSPIRIPDPDQNDIKIHALVWGPMQVDGRTFTVLHALHDIRDPDWGTLRSIEIFGLDKVREEGVLVPSSIESLAQDERLGPAYVLAPASRAVINDDGTGFTPSASEMHQFLNLKRIFVAYVKLLNQTLVRSHRASIDRHAEKRARRRDIEPTVTVVQLRRVKYTGAPPQDDAHPVDWQHSWIVRGHWRWQPCGPNHPLAEPDGHGGYVAHIYVNSHIKGPPDKPLKMSERVYEFSR
jgi:hypothetical protein